MGEWEMSYRERMTSPVFWTNGDRTIDDDDIAAELNRLEAENAAIRAAIEPLIPALEFSQIGTWTGQETEDELAQWETKPARVPMTRKQAGDILAAMKGEA